MWVDRLKFLEESNKFFKIKKQQNTKNLILLLEKHFKTLNDMIIGTSGTKTLESFTISQSGHNNGVKTWVFDATRSILRYRKLPLILICCKIQLPVFFYFLLYISFVMGRYFLPEKNICSNFLFLMDSPPTPQPHLLKGQNLLNVTKVFVDCP